MNFCRFSSLLLILLGSTAIAAEMPKHNDKAPIEVTSDALEVFQQENRAVFSGHVVAIQEDVRLKADKMTVYYRKQDDKPKKAKAAATPESNAIKKIEAEGNVFLSTPQETASGASGTYDVDRQEIHLKNRVVLTRDKNVLKGDALVYNFSTGKSVLTGETVSKTTDGQGKQRVRALFVPEDKGKK